MRRAAGLIASLLLLAGCAAPAATQPVPQLAVADTAPDQDPRALLGNWQVELPEPDAGAPETARFDAGSVELRRDCGTGNGSWRANPYGMFVADLFAFTGGCTDADTPAWLTAAVAFREALDGPELLDRDGQVVAYLRAGEPAQPAPSAGPAHPPLELGGPHGDDDPPPDPYARPTPLPDELTPADGADLVGRWQPAAAGDRGAYLELHRDGGWTGSDGCNPQQGRWVAGPEGAVLGIAGPSTLIGCDNVPVAGWLAGAGRAGFDGDELVLLDPAGAETGRLRQA